jgi:hypothetical protein
VAAPTQAADNATASQQTKAGSTDVIEPAETTTAKMTVAAEGVPAMSTMEATRTVDTTEEAAQGQVNSSPPTAAKADEAEAGTHKATEAESEANPETEAPSTPRVEATEDTGAPHTGPTPVNGPNQEPNRKRRSSSPSHTKCPPMDTEHTRTENTGHQVEPPKVL